MKYLLSFLALCVAFTSCKSEDKPGPSDLVWSITRDLNHVRLADVGTGEFVKDYTISAKLSGLAAKAGGALWLGTTNGHLLRMNVNTGVIEADLSVPNLSYIYGKGNQLWVASYPNRLTKFDPIKNKQVNAFALGTVADTLDALVIEGSNLYALLGNDFSIFKLNVDSGMIAGTYQINAGRYGHGNLAIRSGVIYVIDRYNGQLILLNEAFSVINSVPISSDVGSSMIATPMGVFAASTGGRHFGRLDSGSGTYTPISLSGAPMKMIFQGDHLYFSFGDSSMGAVAQVDPASGRELKSSNGIYADGLVSTSEP